MFVVRQIYIVSGCQELIEFLFGGILGVDLLHGNSLRPWLPEGVSGVALRSILEAIVLLGSHGF